MMLIVRNSLALVCGLVMGSMVNMGLINVGPFIVPLPEGADSSTMEGLREGMKLFTPVNFLFPFLAHAFGTLTGAFIAAKLAVSRPMTLAMIIGGCFLVGGAMMVNTLGGPMWFNITDLMLAYIPMAYFGGIAGRKKQLLKVE